MRNINVLLISDAMDHVVDDNGKFLWASGIPKLFFIEVKGSEAILQPIVSMLRPNK